MQMTVRRAWRMGWRATGLRLVVALLAGGDLGAAVLPGIDVLTAGGFKQLQGKRVGLITNPSGVNQRGFATVDVLRAAPGVQLVALFGPEHGIRGAVRAGDHVQGGADDRTGLPVHSLYGATRKPTPEMLKGLDVMVYDLQDTGVRSYTYVSTMGLAMEACAEAGVAFVVLDRPNPLGGVRVEGPMVEPRFRSFVSQWDVPYVYGLTCGELARMIVGERWIPKPCHLTVVSMKGWTRSMVWRDTGLKWVATSPNVPSADAALGLAALGLLGEMGGGSGLTIGGPLQRPFQALAAPWLDAGEFSAQLARRQLPGVEFPTFSTVHNGKVVNGVSLKFTEPAHAPLVSLSFHALDAIHHVSGRNLLQEAEAAGRNFATLDKAAGSDRWRKELRMGRSAAEIVRQWEAGEESFRRLRRRYLLYPEAGVAKVTAPLHAVGPGKGPPSRAGSKAGKGGRGVTVERGDTAYQIAREFGVTVSALAEANPGVDLARLKPGAWLRVPDRRRRRKSRTSGAVGACRPPGAGTGAGSAVG